MPPGPGFSAPFDKMKHGQYVALRLLSQGHTHSVVAKRLNISDGGLRHRMHALRKTTKTKSTLQLVALAVAHGVITLEDIQ